MMVTDKKEQPVINGQRVKVISGEEHGKTGTVVRVRISDSGAWVRLDSEPVKPIFPCGDNRHNDVVLYPEEVEEAVQVNKEKEN
jgi:hypothetical protein